MVFTSILSNTSAIRPNSKARRRIKLRNNRLYSNCFFIDTPLYLRLHCFLFLEKHWLVGLISIIRMVAFTTDRSAMMKHGIQKGKSECGMRFFIC